MKCLVSVKLVFDCWERGDMSVSDLHAGDTFDGTIRMDIDDALRLAVAVRGNNWPRFLVKETS